MIKIGTPGSNPPWDYLLIVKWKSRTLIFSTVNRGDFVRASRAEAKYRYLFWGSIAFPVGRRKTVSISGDLLRPITVMLDKRHRRILKRLHIDI